MSSSPVEFQLFVAGFCFDPAGRVLLVRKRRPAWQAGRLNGVGGKVESGETPAAAMRREFAEEAGLDLPGWDRFAAVSFSHGRVEFFRLFVTAEMFAAAHACTDEPLEAHRWVDLVASAEVIPNLSWLLPLAAYRHDRYEPVLAVER